MNYDFHNLFFFFFFQFGDFPGGWCMTGDKIYPLNAMLFGTGVYEVVSEVNPVVQLDYFWGAVLP